MASYTWRRYFHGNQSLSAEAFEWEEIWRVYDYVEPYDGIALLDLLYDRPDLRVGQPHPVVPMAFVTDGVSAARLGETSDGWELTVPYKTQTVQRDLLPWERPAEISVETEVVQVPAYKRADGTPILNTAGDFIAGVTRPKIRISFNFEKNVQTIPAWVLTYSDMAINSDVVEIDGLTIAARKLQLQKVRGSTKQPEQVNGATVWYRTLSFSLVFDPEGWEQKTWNRGLREKKSGKLKRCLDDEKEPVTEPVFLAADGSRLATPVDPAAVIEVDASYIVPLPFNALPLT